MPEGQPPAIPAPHSSTPPLGAQRHGHRASVERLWYIIQDLPAMQALEEELKQRLQQADRMGDRMVAELIQNMEETVENVMLAKRECEEANQRLEEANQSLQEANQRLQEANQQV
ncbi:hypothetical protein FSPOR_10585 [Fusarium sporotrichioides]|uniref:Uncharacterized protein n=1 Tax=Fusarium sporotrichioides TaxID=5514 RepID=A0A395RKG7_FUSSP|nr:hypothetical protein FSPOR_10585 [Fusarium sporotrichioides]